MYNTSSHIYGQRYLPIFHLRDGSLTVMNNPSLIALMKFCSSLPIMLTFLMSALCPEILQWLWMEKGDFWCSLNLSAKVIADSPIYSSSHPSSQNVNMCMTPLLMVIGSLYLGAMKKSFMVWSPVKCTCTQYFLTSVFEPLTYPLLILYHCVYVLIDCSHLAIFIVAAVVCSDFCPVDGLYWVLAFLGGFAQIVFFFVSTAVCQRILF